jgi:hypothetical protein
VDSSRSPFNYCKSPPPNMDLRWSPQGVHSYMWGSVTYRFKWWNWSQIGALTAISSSGFADICTCFCGLRLLICAFLVALNAPLEFTGVFPCQVTLSWPYTLMFPLLPCPSSCTPLLCPKLPSFNPPQFYTYICLQPNFCTLPSFQLYSKQSLPLPPFSLV